MKLLTFLLPILVVTGCSVMESKPQPTPNELAAQKGYLLGDEVSDISNYDIYSWQYVSKRSLIIPARPSKHYLLMLDRDCNELKTSEVIAFTSTVNSLRAGFDAVIVSSTPGIKNKCFVDKIYEIRKDKK